MKYVRQTGNKSFVVQTLLSLFPDKKIKLADLASQIRREMYVDLPAQDGLHHAYQRLSSDFREGICYRKWGKKDGYQLAKLDGSDGWVYVGWVPETELYD